MHRIILIIAVFFVQSCVTYPLDYSGIADRNFREDMQQFVIRISTYAKVVKPGFIIIPQNGLELLLDNQLSRYRESYLEAIDGVGQEELNFGSAGINSVTSAESHAYLLTLLAIAKQQAKQVLVIDYCTHKELVDKTYAVDDKFGFIGFAADRKALTSIPVYPPQPWHNHGKSVTRLDEVRNFLYLINTESFEQKVDFLNALRSTNFDLIVVDLFFEDEVLSAEDVGMLQQKPGGGKRLVLAYMSLGEAESYRYYWQKSWDKKRPVWLEKENPDWPGNFKVRYWEPAWQKLIIDNKHSYLNRILAAGFDGVYLDIIDGFYYFEQAVRSAE